MKSIDLTGSARISNLMELSRALRQCKTPYEALLMYSAYLGKAYPNYAQLVLSTRGLANGEFRVWRLRDDAGVEHVEPTDPWLDLNHPIKSGGVIAKIIADQSPH